MTADPMLFDGYPDVTPEPEPEQTNHDKRRAALDRRRHRIQAAIAGGYHPLTQGLQLLGDNRDGAGHTCGDCVHRIIKRLGGDYPKCDLGPITGGPGTDVLARYPACVRWEPK